MELYRSGHSDVLHRVSFTGRVTQMCFMELIIQVISLRCASWS